MQHTEPQQSWVAVSQQLTPPQQEVPGPQQIWPPLHTFPGEQHTPPMQGFPPQSAALVQTWASALLALKIPTALAANVPAITPRTRRRDVGTANVRDRSSKLPLMMVDCSFSFGCSGTCPAWGDSW